MKGSVASLLLVRVLVAVSRERRDDGAAAESPPLCRRGLPEGFLPVMVLLEGGAEDEEEAPVLSMWK